MQDCVHPKTAFNAQQQLPYVIYPTEVVACNFDNYEQQHTNLLYS
jgi:hypothetical protein